MSQAILDLKGQVFKSPHSVAEQLIPPETTGCYERSLGPSGAAMQTLQTEFAVSVSILWHAAHLSALVSCPR